MTISGMYTFAAKAEEVWDLLLDPQALLKILPGLQTVDVRPDGEIIASAMVNLGPIRGTLSGRLRLLEEQKPTHLKIVSEGKGGARFIKGMCVIDAVEQAGTTLINYQAEVSIGGIPARAGERLIEAAINSTWQRVAWLLDGAHHADASVDPGAELSNLSKAAQMWDEADTGKMREVAWSSIQHIAEAYATEFSGHVPAELYIHQLLAERLVGEKTGLKGAALVCGDMASERPHFEADQIVAFSEVDGFDISSASLSKYHPKRLRFNPHVTDCNNFILEPEKYDLVVVTHGAHHVYNLGNFFYQARKSLKDHGLFFMAEWIGPEYLQMPRANHAIATLLLLTLFHRKARTTHMGLRKGLWIQPAPNSFEPSEACNSTELMPQFLKYFKPINLVYYGGLAYPVFEGIAQNIDQAKFINQAKVKLVSRLENLLTRLKIVKPLFVTALAEKRAGIF